MRLYSPTKTKDKSNHNNSPVSFGSKKCKAQQKKSESTGNYKDECSRFRPEQ